VKRNFPGRFHALTPFVFYMIPQISAKRRRMGITKIIADIMADDPHEVREKRGTRIKTAFVQTENDLPDGSGGTAVFMAAEYKRKTNIRNEVAQDKRKTPETYAVLFHPPVNRFRHFVMVYQIQFSPPFGRLSSVEKIAGQVIF
jgi:hypothetical protein